MTVSIDGPVGLRWRTQNVTNNSADQAQIIQMLAMISILEGGKKELWLVPPLAGPDGSCPQLLADAIWDFQFFWKEQGVFQVIDGVVDPDKNTIRKLNELTGGVLPDLRPFVDVIVKFQGVAEHATPLLPNEVFPDAMLTTYNQKNGRMLTRIGHRTNTIQEASAALIATHVAQIKAAFGNNQRGKVFIYGSSSGGRNAIDLAVSLTSEQIPIAYLAALDAAWFPEDAVNAPNNFFGEPTVIPQFNAGGILADRKEDYFQTHGNHSETTFHGILFTSHMAGKEIHGNVVGFAPQDFTNQVRAVNPNMSDADAHIELIRIATPLVRDRIRAILDNL